MEIIKVTAENLEQEHICCAISDKKGDCRVPSKKAWMRAAFGEGLVFLKYDVRGKAFLEYLPAEHAWYPVDAPGYLFIDCFWVSGQYKGKGLSNGLLEACLQDAKAQGKHGVVALTSKKKLPFLCDPKHLAYKGFEPVDEARILLCSCLPFSRPQRHGSPVSPLRQGGTARGGRFCSLLYEPVPSYRGLRAAGRSAGKGTGNPVRSSQAGNARASPPGPHSGHDV